VLEFDIPPDHLAQGIEAEEKGDPAAALQAYQRALEQAPRNTQAWWRMGRLQARLGNRPEALRCFEKVLEIRPGHSEFRVWYERYKAQ
jgi:predicted TPR repeat methyltransferase